MNRSTKSYIWDGHRNTKLACLDIDGVLSDYPKCWIDFVNDRLDSEFTNLHEIKSTLAFSRYRELKIEYRTSGYKRSLPVKDGAVDFTIALREAGFIVVLLSSRPIHEHPEIFPDTKIWLENNGFCYDQIIWSDTKHGEAIKNFPYMKFLVDDNSEISNQVARAGFRVYLLSNSYNISEEVHSRVIRVPHLSNIAEIELSTSKINGRGNFSQLHV